MGFLAAWWRLRARLALMLGAQKQARRCFEQLLQLKPDDPQALGSLAFLAGSRGEHAQAVALQRRAVLLQPSAGAWYNLGYLLERSGDAVEAEDAFRQALGLNERLDLAWYGLGLALSRQGRVQEAAQAFRENTARQPFSPHGWEQLARLHVQCGEADKAREVLTHLHTFEPKAARRLRAELAPSLVGSSAAA